eukprot:SAG31_NODE_639_length_13309_cov_4.008468_18_plen_70_part_00
MVLQGGHRNIASDVQLCTQNLFAQSVRARAYGHTRKARMRRMLPEYGACRRRCSGGCGHEVTRAAGIGR